MTSNPTPRRRSLLGRRALTVLAAGALALGGVAAGAGSASAEECNTWNLCIFPDGNLQNGQGIWWDEDCLADYTWDKTGGRMNDSISRIHSNETGYGTFYQHCYFGGASLWVSTYKEVNLTSGGGWNDSISSWDLVRYGA
ncbi:hypothetical protein [Streptomyces sp. NPDC058548]|uniref:hypothetical protein n=1 Tax=unclassified Streptomyces TaxID=2593676 RepID=UPI003650076F